MLSKAALPTRKVHVKGFAWCKDQPMVIGVNRLTSKILCQHHNNLLSDVDVAGAHAIRVFEEFRRKGLTADKRNHRVVPQKPIEYLIEGVLFERWLLKSTLNLCYGGSWSEFPSGAVKPPAELVRSAFGIDPIPKQRGVHLVVARGSEIGSTSQIQFAALSPEPGLISGGIWSIYGIPFAFLIAEARGSEIIGLEQLIRLRTPERFHPELKWHPPRVVDHDGSRVYQVVRFSW